MEDNDRMRLNRRAFLAGSAVAALAHVTEAQGAPIARTYPLNRNWQFQAKAGGEFQRVTLPHTNVDLPWHSFDDKSYEFVSHYRRPFRAPAAWAGHRVFADFDGVMTAAKVSINGHQFPEYRGGYTPFSWELTPHLKPGGDNLLEVEVDSTERP